MEKVTVVNLKGEKVNDITLNENIFGITPNDTTIYDALRLTSSSMRQGSAETKTRSEVSGGGRKPWKQKGTGRARQGSIRAAQWYHGGVVFGPHNRDYSFKMNRKERRLALKSALAYKAINNELLILDEFKLESNKTKEAKEILTSLNATKNTLLIVDDLTDNIILATRNLKNIVVLEPSEINTYDVIAADKMIVTTSSLKQIEEALK